jgi:hypothetical protein
MKYVLAFPPGTWYLKLDYTNLSGTTSGFGLKIVMNSQTIADDTVPLLFQDSEGVPLANGTPVQSSEYRITTTGGTETLELIWTYGEGSLQINTLTMRTSDRYEGEYYIKAEIHDGAGNDIYFGDAPTIESTGRKNIFEVLNWDFMALYDTAAPVATVTWMTSSELPIQFRQVSMSEIIPAVATDGMAGFESFRWECVKRAEKSVVTAFNEHTRTSGTLYDFTTDGTVWNSNSTDNWMALIEVREPRLRQLVDVPAVISGRQYEVSGTDVANDYVVYNGGTYALGDVFNGTATASSFLPYGIAQVDQVGAFRRSVPVDMGHPALMPLGLRFDETVGLIRMDNEPKNQVPTIVAMQPWMVEAGLYAVDSDFRSADTAATAPTTITVAVEVAPAGAGYVSGTGRYSIFDTVAMNATSATGGIWTWNFTGWYDTNSVLLSTGTDYSFPAEQSVNLIAQFVQV